MGNKDISEKNLEQYQDVFSDIVNALLYCGKSVVKDENLRPAPTETFYQSGDGNWRRQVQDISMYENRDGRIYMQYAIENQTGEEVRMVLRTAGYEGAVYRGQYERQETFGVITLVLNWGERLWDCAADLHGFLADKEYPDGVKRYIDNHVLHVFHMRHLPLDVRERFHSDMRIVVDYLAEQEDYKPTNQTIRHLDALLFMMQALTGDNRFEEMLIRMKDKEEQKGEVCMCELFDRYWNDGVSQGILQGIVQSIQQVLSCHGAVSEELKERIGSEKDIDKLNNWIMLAAMTGTVEEFEANM